MATEEPSGTGDAAQNHENDVGPRSPDPFIQARVSDPSVPVPPSLALSGLFGDSDRSGRHRLYLNTRLDYYVEFSDADVLVVESIGPDLPPFVGLDATRVTLVRDAHVDYVRSRTVESTDWLDVTPQVAATAAPPIQLALSRQIWNCETHEATACRPQACDPTLWGTCVCTENTCATACNQATCRGTCNTCATACNQGTCAGRTCNQGTCAGTCKPATCVCTEFRPGCPTFAGTRCPTCRAGCDEI